ncbi:MAG: hypothetical protein JOS17DRAFT_759676 [Linnemannia elongata]|nr:MAG: hypothetical protein JOS17DRAFT_759676 [Linnemannia elongata]
MYSFFHPFFFYSFFCLFASNLLSPVNYLFFILSLFFSPAHRYALLFPITSLFQSVIVILH